jgi:hypothetical protein
MALEFVENKAVTGVEYVVRLHCQFCNWILILMEAMPLMSLVNPRMSIWLIGIS